ncbi:hypothetical protein C8R46DRAFT_1037746 [Mycena filopes]|nr:hypothetical protein C8R46DRAFT_1037746 [Mycena filopes]
MPGLRTMCAKPREKETARIERCALSPEAARSTRIKKCTRCEAARQQQEMYAVHTRGSARAQRETCTGRAHQGMYAARGCESSSMICASRDARGSHPTRERERERERLRAMHTSRDVRGARLREQRHDVRIERYAQSHPARMRERLRATHTSRDGRDARLREQRHDVRIERYAQFTPSERERGCARRTHREMYAMRGCESSGMMCASRDTRSHTQRERERGCARRTHREMYAMRGCESSGMMCASRDTRSSHPAREREAAKAAARERREREREMGGTSGGDARVEAGRARRAEREI